MQVIKITGLKPFSRFHIFGTLLRAISLTILMQRNFMKSCTAKIITPLLVMVGALAASPVHAAEFTAKVTTTEYLVPLKGKGPCSLRGVSAGGGATSLFDSATLGASDCITMIPGEFPYPSGFQFSNGLMVFTAPSGDTISATYQGQFGSPAPLTNGLITYTITTATYTIIGGTGVYRRATGAGALSGTSTIDPTGVVPAQGTLFAKGTISY